MIFDIQRFSIHDGPGIRSVVFLKGCSLSCEWCENPESQSLESEVFHDHSRCQFCGSCLKPESGGVMHITDEGIVPDRSKPVPASFIGICPTTATRVVGTDMTAQEIFQRVMRDEPFFRRSQGGVTFSGGEPLLQPKLLIECIELFEKEQISVAIETCLAVNSSAVDALISHPIHWLLDVKHVDAEKFKKGTGGQVSFVLQNLRRVATEAKHVTYRVPVIPRFNDSEGDMKEILAFISDITPKETANRELNILPFHNMASGKYKLLGKESPYGDTEKIDQITLNQWCQAGSALGFDTSIGG